MRKLINIWIMLLLAAVLPAAGGAVIPYAPDAQIADFHAALREDGSVLVQWRTTLELGVDAFRLLCVSDVDGTRQPVGPGWIGASRDENGHSYAVTDRPATAGESRHYLLQLISRVQPDRDLATWAGSLLPMVKPALAPAVEVAQSVNPLSQGTPAVRQSWIGSGARVRAWTHALPADRVRLSLRDSGVCRINAGELASASGWGFDVITNAMALTNLNFSCQGAPVAWYAEGTNLFFYGVPAQSRFAPENVYWVALGAGSNMVPRNLTPGVPATTNAWFQDQLICQGTSYLYRVSYSSLADLPVSYLAFNPPLAPSPGYGIPATSLVVTNVLVDCATGMWTGVVTVNLCSYYDGDSGADTYTTRVLVGGVELGDPAWTGEQYVLCSYAFTSTNLVAGAAALQIDNIGRLYADYSPFCISYAYIYPRLYRAAGNALRCTGGESNTVAVAGFTTNDLLVLDVTTTNLPCLAGPVTLTCDALSSNWSISFPCGGTDRVYVVASKSSGVLLPSIRGVQDVDWTSPTNAADYVILVPPEGWRADIRPVLQPLADFRNQQGLHTVIVDVESLYNQFSYGLVDPQAIHAFCCAGYTNWPGHPLRYVLLAGAGSLDFKHDALSVNDYTACLIPTLIAGQRIPDISFGMTLALDQALGDVTGDAAPEVVVGRLPTTSTQDMAVVVQKTIAYEGALPWKQQAVVAADWDNVYTQYYPFGAGTDQFIPALRAAGRTVVKSYYSLDPVSSDPGNMLPTRVDLLFPALVSGSGLFHFFGHSDEYSLSQGGSGSSRLLYNSTISNANWTTPTIAVIIGCRVNKWQKISPTVCILPYGVFAPGTGFVAGLGATGDLLMQESADLGVALYAQAATNGTLRLGDVLKNGLQQMTGEMSAERLQSIGLTGDPALVFRHDITAMGTPVSWLVQHGLTAPNADLADPNHNGWPTWQEYLAGTDPTSSVLRVASAGIQMASNRMTLAFNTSTGATYRVLYKADLTATDAWQAVAWSTNAAPWSQQLILPMAPLITVDVPLTNSPATQGFYRVCWTN